MHWVEVKWNLSIWCKNPWGKMNLTLLWPTKVDGQLTGLCGKSLPRSAQKKHVKILYNLCLLDVSGHDLSSVPGVWIWTLCRLRLNLTDHSPTATSLNTNTPLVGVRLHLTERLEWINYTRWINSSTLLFPQFIFLLCLRLAQLKCLKITFKFRKRS